MTTYQSHARIMKKIINLDAGGIPNICMYRDCENHAYQMYAYPECRHPVGWKCRYAEYMAMVHGGGGAHIWMAFCSEGHLELFRWGGGWRALVLIEEQGRAWDMLPTGYKGLLQR